VLGVFGMPGIDVGLVAGAQAALPLREPVEEQRGLFDLVVGELAAGRLIGLFSAQARSRGRISQVANR
jgi:hypothetical protein